MKKAIITLSAIALLGCSYAAKKTEQEPKLSINECYEKNLKDSTLMTDWYCVVHTNDGFSRQLDKSDEIYLIDPCPVVTVEGIIKLEVKDNNYGDTMLTMQFGKRGTAYWSAATTKWVGRKLAFIVDDKLISTSVVNTPVTAGISAIGRKDYSKADLDKIKQQIENRQKYRDEQAENK